MSAENLWNPKDFYSSITPFLLVAKIFGVQPITREKGTYRRSKSQYVFMCANFGIFATSFYFTVTETEVRNNEMSDVYLATLNMYDILIYTRFLLIYVLCFKYSNAEIDLYKFLDKLDGILKSVGRLNDLLATNKQVLLKAYSILAFALFTQIVTEMFILVVSFKFVTFPIIVCRCLPSFIGTLMKCYFYLWTFALKRRFEIVNSSLRVIKKQSKCKKKFMFSVYKFERELSKLMDLHKELVNVSRMMNELFQVEIIWHFMLIFNVIFANGYYIMFIVLTKSENAFIYVFSVVKNYLFVWFEMYVLVRSSALLCKEACRTKDILNVVQIEPYDESSLRLVIASMYELKENKLEITACRLFNIDYSTIFAMMSNIANYIFIMLQLETD